MELFKVIAELLSGHTLPIGVALLAIIGLIYVYNDSKKERFERQKVMDLQNAQWLELYKENLEETAELRKEMGKTREVISELKGVIQSLYDMGIKRAN
jgi:cbb3-type cytochrome oxidase subunit 3